MWTNLSKAILNNRITLSVLLLVITAFMGYRASKVELSYEMARVLPTDDPIYQDYLRFKSLFGEDGSVMVIGFQDEKIFELKKFKALHELGTNIKHIEGIKNVLSIASLYTIERNDSLKKFDFNPLTAQSPKDQQEMDSIKKRVLSLPFYQGLAYNKETHAGIMAITFKTANLNSKDRISIVKQIKEEAGRFSEKTGIELHYSGMPYIRTEFMKMVSSEMRMFLVLAIIVTSLILFVFFRSFQVVLFSMIIMFIGVTWSIGTLELMGYKISILSGMIPAIITIICIPNCIFLINKYHTEYAEHGNKEKALLSMTEKMGLTLFLANVTTAIGFGVFYFTKSILLMEFGIVAAVNVMISFAITLILIPAIFSFLPEPSMKRTQHLEAKRINKVLAFIDHIVHHRRKVIYGIIALITLISGYGITKIKVIGYVVDDLPKDHPIYHDLRFFEKNFGGVLPFEIGIDTKKENGVFANNARTLYKIKSLQRSLTRYSELSKPLSLVEGIKFSYQSYKGGAPKYYRLPDVTELRELSGYVSTVKGRENQLGSFIDSTRRYTRVSYQMADVGSVRMKEIAKEVQAVCDSVFDKENYTVSLTGHSLVFLKNNDYLLSNLFESLLIEIVLITMIGILLFRSVRIIILSKLPCLIPLVITAGIMGFAGIEFKASTILIFTIAFGIASDGTIYFLTRYRHELKKNKLHYSHAISLTIKETGLSMIYTALILFFGFAIFTASDFGGTIALGILVSLTLLISMCTNLILLPSILISIGKNQEKKKKHKQKDVMETSDFG